MADLTNFTVELAARMPANVNVVLKGEIEILINGQMASKQPFEIDLGEADLGNLIENGSLND
jgi:hypothetical protein